jgi:ligand-binding sensor domain-containing protein
VCGDPTNLPGLAAARQRRLCLQGVIWCLLFLSWTPPAAAQSRFDTWTTENGLPQNSINDIVQTRDGFLWLATYGGLVRFDGTRFVVFDRSIDGIESQRIRRLREDRDGTLWAVSEEGVLIRYRAGRFTSFASERGLPTDNSLRLDEGADGHLWITSLGSVTMFDGERAVSYGATDFPALAARIRVERPPPCFRQKRKPSNSRRATTPDALLRRPLSSFRSGATRYIHTIVQ